MIRTIDSPTLLKISIMLFVLSNGINLFINLITLGYPLYRIHIMLKYLINNILERRKKSLSDTDREIITESVLWLKYLSLLSAWTFLDTYLNYVPILGLISPYIKICVFGYTLLQYHLESKYDFWFYDGLTEIFRMNTNFSENEFNEVLLIVRDKIDNIKYWVIYQLNNLQLNPKKTE